MPRRRAPVERIVDLAVAIPVSSLVAARRLAPVVVRAARTLARGTAGAPGPASDAAVAGDVEVAAEVDSRSPVVPADEGPADAVELPIDGYDQLAARQIIDRLAALTPSDLDAVEAHERAHRNRSTVLGRIAQLRA